MTEQELQSSVECLARRYGYIYYHTHDSRHSAAGFPDLVLVRSGRTIFAECKSENGKLTPEQNVWIEALVIAGNEVYVWYPKHLSEIADILSLWEPPRKSQLLEFDSSVVKIS